VANIAPSIAEYAWAGWNSTYSTSTVGLITWDEWNSTYSTSTVGNASWACWNSTYSGTTFTVTAAMQPAWQSWNNASEERHARQVAQAERRLRQVEADQRLLQVRETANRRAEELLLSLLTDEQAASYVQRGWFEVRGSRGGRWRIRSRGQAGNVDLMPEIGEIREASFCCHPPGGLPAADAHLAQMLHLVTDEEGFRRTANRAA